MASDDGTTLTKLGGTRKPPMPGDIFCMLPSDQLYLFGRVVIIDAPQPAPAANLVYIYEARAETPDPPLDLLRRDGLLIAPTWTNRLGWTKGYWRTVMRQPLMGRDVLEKHCFVDPLRRSHVDEEGGRTEHTEPCGLFGLASYRLIEDLICSELGLRPAPEGREH